VTVASFEYRACGVRADVCNLLVGRLEVERVHVDQHGLVLAFDVVEPDVVPLAPAMRSVCGTAVLYVLLCVRT
jgi:hypothetical protein